VSAESERPREAVEVEKWIGKAQKGDREALGRLLNVCRHYLLLMANQELTPALWAKIAPSDIVQDTLLEAGRDFPRFHGGNEEELLVWLGAILRNNVANVRRHFETAKREVDREIPLEELPRVEMPPDQTESPSRQAQAHEQDEQLEKALRQLPEHYRQVLRMHTTDGLSFVQIAAKMGTSADAVRKLFGRAVEDLAKHLDTPHESA
jgi:RNA polymerase sigma-70 factor, ECF subfamily